MATLSCKVLRSSGRRIARCKVSHSRGKTEARLTIRVRRGGKTASASHRSLRKGRATIDVPLSRTLKGRYEVVLILDDGTTVKTTIVLR